MIDKQIDSSSAARGGWGCWRPEETAVRGQEEGAASGRWDAGHEAPPGGADVTQQWSGTQATTVRVYTNFINTLSLYYNDHPFCLTKSFENQTINGICTVLTICYILHSFWILEEKNFKEYV